MDPVFWLVERLAYTGHATFDLLPAGDTGFYWANGILIGSTLDQRSNSGYDKIALISPIQERAMDSTLASSYTG